MGLNPPVPQQDSNWEIRVALLLSLLLQVLLMFLGPMRKRSASPISRFIIWPCYLLADWVADLGLGLLLNNMGNIGGDGGNSTSSFGLKRGGGGGTTSTTGSSNDAGSSSSPIIFAFWTPFLLLHLGGPDTITAYSLEDNELWLRHLVGLLFELFSAAVVILCSVRGNRLILATTLMMVVGVIKYGERTYSLYCGSIERFRSNAAGPPDPGPNYAKLMTVFDSKEKAGMPVEICIANGEASESKKEMEKLEAAHRVMSGGKSLELQAYEFFLIFQCLSVNLSMSFRNVRLSQALFSSNLNWEPSEALGMIEMELNFVYDAMYTKSPVAHTKAGWALRCVSSGCIMSALVIFFHHDKGGIARVDVGITYALLLGAVALDVVALAMLLFSDRAAVVFQTYRCRGRRQLRWLAWLTQAVTRRWSRTTSQFNLISYCLGRPDHYSGRLWHRLAKVLRVEGILEDLIFIRHVSLSELTDSFIFFGVKDALHKLNADQEEWKKAAAQKLKMEQETKAAAAAAGTGTPEEATKDEIEAEKDAMAEKDAIAEVCRRRGDGVVKSHKYRIKETTTTKHGHGEDRYKVILDSVVKSDFDESLLLWHIATDLCRYRANETAGAAGETVSVRPVGPLDPNTVKMQAIAETLSEYMLYLLVKQPEMESARTGIWLMRYQDSCAEARRFFGSMAAWNPDHDDARRMLLSVNTTRRPAELKGDDSKSVLFDAVILAKALRELDEALMWEVVAGVWGEMLMYTASKCRGTTHVRLLNRGGELLTLVWFLMANMGLGDTYQIEEGNAQAKLIVKDQ